jgi:hypothetical protein
VRTTAVCVGLALATTALPAQRSKGLLVQGILDAEVWSTDSLSNLLTRNGGRPGVVGRGVVWAAAEPWERVFVYATGVLASGNARPVDDRPRAELEQLGVRWHRSAALLIDIGRIPSPIGAFAPRRFSTRNPLIGVPDGYPVQYPWGVMASGATTTLDYRVGVMSLPVAHEGYVPEPTSAFRPVIGGGITPVVGVRLGVSATAGPYLNDSLSATQLGGESWRSYGQRVLAADLHASRGHADLRGEWARSRYEVPGQQPIQGTTYYGEGTYALTPRIFAAIRHELNAYPFIRAFGDAWTARLTAFQNTEVGAGFRWNASTLLKASYRSDRWEVNAQNSGFIRPGGHAFAVQLSRTFDAASILDRQ